MIDEYLGKRIECACGRVHDCGATRIVRADAGALDEVGPIVRDLTQELPVRVVCDPVTLEVAGREVLERLVGAGVRASLLVIGRPGTVLQATGEVVEEVRAGRPGDFGLLVAVGSGTINDVCKLAAHQSGVPYVCVATAPSMNGYTSSIAAVLAGGIKRTIPCSAPHAVFAEARLLAAAPGPMIAAGVGDLLSKEVASADWFLASVVKEESFCEVPVRMAGEAVEQVVCRAVQIGERDPEALAVLAEALLLSGLSMTAAGSSAPASGGEHLVSHTLDMRRHAGGAAPLALHGIQVAFGTFFTARLYRRVFSRPPDLDRLERSLRDLPATCSGRAEQVRGRHAGLPPEVMEKVEEESLAKFVEPPQRRRELGRIVERWEELAARFLSEIPAAQELERSFREAGGPCSLEEAGIDRRVFLDAALTARDIRGRYTILDLAEEMGLLEMYARVLI